MMPAHDMRERHDTSQVRRIADFAAGYTLEATRPSEADVAALKPFDPQGAQIYLSAVPSHTPDESVEEARRLRAAGFEPVPHLAARGLESAAAVQHFLTRARAEADIRRVLVIGGDRDRPVGPFTSALELIESGLLQDHGIEEIGIAGYPEGHPRLSEIALDRALAAKIEAAEGTGLRVHIVTQFCFAAEPIIAWLERLRDQGIDHPVKVGMAGPTSITALLRYAARCGVKASALGLARHGSLAKHLIGGATPDGIVRALAEATAGGGLGKVKPHFFSFGGLPKTVRWAAATAAGHIVIDRADGFGVQPK